MEEYRGNYHFGGEDNDDYDKCRAGRCGCDKVSGYRNYEHKYIHFDIYGYHLYNLMVHRFFFDVMDYDDLYRCDEIELQLKIHKIICEISEEYGMMFSDIFQQNELDVFFDTIVSRIM